MHIPDFIHIHNHTQYSKFDGFSSVEDLVGQAREFGMRAVGLTDHGTVAGAIAFLKECRKKGTDLPEHLRDKYPDGIHPIIGMETYLSRDHLCHDKEGQPDGRKGNRHLNVIAKNFEGFQNLCALSHEACVSGYYYDPRIDFELLEKHKEGLIVTSACLSNIINFLLSVDEYEKALRAAGAFKDIFHDDFYLEMMYHGIDREAKILPGIQQLGKDLNVKIIGTNDCHYVKKEDAEFQQVLTCISSGRSIKDPNRIKFPYDEFYFKSQAEMQQLFKTVPSILTNTIEIAEKCDYSEIIFGQMRLPKFKIPPEFKNPYEYLSHLAYAGLKRLGLEKSEKHVTQLRRELDDIKLIWDTKRYDFATYFLIVEDLMTYARKNNIAAGIRGSGVGSVLIYCLGISEGVDPVQHELIWERFLGFDWLHFISEEDFGIKAENEVSKSSEISDLLKEKAVAERGSGATG